MKVFLRRLALVGCISSMGLFSIGCTNEEKPAEEPVTSEPGPAPAVEAPAAPEAPAPAVEHQTPSKDKAAGKKKGAAKKAKGKAHK